MRAAQSDHDRNDLDGSLTVHKLLERQVRRFFGTPDAVPAELQPFLALVDAAYCDADRDHSLLQHSMDTVSQELVERNRLLARQLAEKQRLEIELARAQKLESVGQLAAGIAHEINTPVQFVGDSLYFLKDAAETLRPYTERMSALRDRSQRGELRASDWDALDALKAELDIDYLLENMPKAADCALEGVNRVGSIVRAMKSFAHPDQPDQTNVLLDEAIRNTLIVARNEIKYVADVQTDLGEVPPVRCFAGDVNQLLINILVNASHSIEDVVRGTGERGRITVTLERDGEEAVIAIADTGTGIPEAIRERIFDPYFTTKELGRGMGQGLAIAHNIVVKRHGGSLRFDTKEGVGTTFFIRLPIDGLEHRDSGNGR
jgi:signal transduction histidine kinase